MNAFSVDRKVIRRSATGRGLALNIEVDENGIGVVLGNDVARVADVAFGLSLIQRCKGGWHRNTLRELACQTVTGVPLSTTDYSRLMSQTRKQVAADLLRVDGGRRIPTVERILEQRLRPVGIPTWMNGPGKRVLSDTDSLLKDLKTSFIDDAIKGMIDTAPFPQYGGSAFYEHITFVALLSASITDAEQRLLLHYLRAAETAAPHVRIVLVIDDTETWNELRQSALWENWANMKHSTPIPWPEECSTRYELGRVEWEPGDLDKQIKRVVKLVMNHILDGGQLTDVTIVAEDISHATVVRQKLLEAGISVTTSESYLLPMRPQVVTLMSLLSVANGCGRVQGLIRMMDVWPALNENDFAQTFEYFSHMGKYIDESHGVIDDSLIDFMNALSPLTELSDDTEIRVWMKNAVLAFNGLPVVKGHDYILECAESVCRWGANFKSLEELLSNFWRLRTIYSGWQGYRRHGVYVWHEAFYVKSRIAVVLREETEANETSVSCENVYIAPLKSRNIA